MPKCCECSSDSNSDCTLVFFLFCIFFVLNSLSTNFSSISLFSVNTNLINILSSLSPSLEICLFTKRAFFSKHECQVLVKQNFKRKENLISLFFLTFSFFVSNFNFINTCRQLKDVKISAATQSLSIINAIMDLAFLMMDVQIHAKSSQTISASTTLIHSKENPF